MNKKTKFSLFMIMVFLPLSSIKLNAASEPLPLQVEYNDPAEGQGRPQKSPILVPEVSIEDYTLSFDHSCLGCTLRLVDASDNVAYTTVINGDTLVLPSTLSGEYELQILFDDCYFFGFVGF